ncbi:MAG: phage holin family protein [Actinobacteria bacterium]|nr:phage holin family protein [Actinomycetota bacterium]
MRIILSVLVQLIANAIALVVAAQLLDGMTLHVDGFFVAVGIFTIISIIASPMIKQATIKGSTVLLGSTALITSLVALIGTRFITHGLEVHGVSTWVLAAVAVWAAGLIATALIPFVIFKSLRENKDSK